MSKIEQLDLKFSGTEWLSALPIVENDRRYCTGEFAQKTAEWQRDYNNRRQFSPIPTGGKSNQGGNTQAIENETLLAFNRVHEA